MEWREEERRREKRREDGRYGERVVTISRRSQNYTTLQLPHNRRLPSDTKKSAKFLTHIHRARSILDSGLEISKQAFAKL